MRTKTVEYSNKKSKYLSGFLILHWFFKYLFCLVRTEISGRRRVHFAGIQENSNTLVTKSYQNSSKIDWRGVLLYVCMSPPLLFLALFWRGQVTGFAGYQLPLPVGSQRQFTGSSPPATFWDTPHVPKDCGTIHNELRSLRMCSGQLTVKLRGITASCPH